MKIFEQLDQWGHEQVVFFQDRETGLRSIIGIHNTVLGPTLGGCRMWKYQDEDDALTDLLRLSKAMTYKAAVAGLDLGGGKGIIVGDPQSEKTPELLRAFGRAVESLGGRYITTEDVGISVPDVDIIQSATQYAVGGSRAGGAGDPSGMTAFGIFQGMRAALKYAHLGESLSGLRVAVQGIGNVGFNLCSHLAAQGVKLIVCDIYAEKAKRAVQEFAAQQVLPNEIFSVDCDIFAPCALGAVLNPRSISQLNCKLVAGAANNQLQSDSDGLSLSQRGIVYVPDYAINAGGLINVAAELNGYDREAVRSKTSEIFFTIDLILSRAKKEGVLPLQVANTLAEERIEKARRRPKTLGAEELFEMESAAARMALPGTVSSINSANALPR